MNIWLHKQIMQKLAKNGGKVPDDLNSQPNSTGHSLSGLVS
jgi:Domain of unknown function (DUF3597)